MPIFSMIPIEGIVRMLIKGLTKSSMTRTLYDIRMEELKILLISETQLPIMYKGELMQVLPVPLAQT